MLKTKTITTANATVLVVEFPKRAIPKDSYCDAILYSMPNGYVETEYPIESDGTWEWQLLGRLPDITEEQAGNILDRLELLPFADAKSDLIYYLKKEGVYFENPLGERPEFNDGDLWDVPELDTQIMAGRQYNIDKWHEAQSKVWDKERCYLFIKVD